MVQQPFFVVVDVVENGSQLVVVQTVGRQVLDDDVLQFAQLNVRLAVVLGEGFYVVVVLRLVVEQRVYVWEHHFLFVLHVRTYAVCIFVVQFKYESG